MPIVRKCFWKEVKQILENLIPKELFKVFTKVANDIPDKDYLYNMEFSYGDKVICDAKFNKSDLNFDHSVNATTFMQDTTYADDILGIIQEGKLFIFDTNQCEYLYNFKGFNPPIGKINGRSRRKGIEEPDPLGSNYYVPLSIIEKGNFFGTFGTSSYLANVLELEDTWYATAGSRNKLLTIPFNNKTFIDNYDQKSIFLKNFTTIDDIYSSHEESYFSLLKKLNYDEKLKIFIFPKYWFNINLELDYNILKIAWSQSVSLRNVSEEEKIYELIEDMRGCDVELIKKYLYSFYQIFKSRGLGYERVNYIDNQILLNINDDINRILYKKDNKIFKMLLFDYNYLNPNHDSFIISSLYAPCFIKKVIPCNDSVINIIKNLKLAIQHRKRKRVSDLNYEYLNSIEETEFFVNGLGFFGNEGDLRKNFLTLLRKYEKSDKKTEYDLSHPYFQFFALIPSKPQVNEI